MSGAAAATLSRLRRVPVRRALADAVAGLSPRTRRRLLVAGVAFLVLVAGYRLWLRDSSLVAVDRVTVSGVTTSDAERVRLALTSTGRTMTTLHVRRDDLLRAVKPYPVVRDLEVTTDFPHGLRVRVIEHHAAAMAVSDTGQVPVAADGTILRGLPAAGRLPVVRVSGPLGTARLGGAGTLAAVAIAGTAPGPLHSRIELVRRRSDKGLVAILSDGPDLIFGTATQLRAKWAAAARVLADLEARGASYVDLRIPGRPAVGGLGTASVAPPTPQAAAANAAPAATAAPPTAPAPTAGSAAAGQPAGVTATTPSPSAVLGATGGGATASPTP